MTSTDSYIEKEPNKKKNRLLDKNTTALVTAAK